MNTAEIDWHTYLEKELPMVRELLSLEGITLAEEQPHIKGERYLIQALTTLGGRKLILLGEITATKTPVVIKATNDTHGIQELLHERTCRSLLHDINFSYESFHSPKEYLFIKKQGYVISVSEYIAQSCSFLERPLPEQFSFALRALKAQELTRATTATHLKKVARVFGTRTSDTYRSMLQGFLSAVGETREFETATSRIKKVQSLFAERSMRVEQYCGFLTHTDFVPHNFRIRDSVLYLLDFSSLRFGNKHEGWARFLNFMTLYNRDLEELLTRYIRENRSSEEQESLHLLRLFRLAELITYYVGTLKKSSGTLFELNQARIHFWSDVLEAELMSERVSDARVAEYITLRDRLRSDEEIQRQQGLH